MFYLGDINVYSKSAMPALRHVRTALTLIQNARVALKLAKCFFSSSTVPYLRPTIRLGQLAVDNTNCDAFRKFLPLTIKTKLRSFVGIRRVYCRFVSNFAQVAAQLNVRAGRNQPFELELNVVELDTFQELK